MSLVRAESITGRIHDYCLTPCSNHVHCTSKDRPWTAVLDDAAAKADAVASAIDWARALALDSAWQEELAKAAETAFEMLSFAAEKA